MAEDSPGFVVDLGKPASPAAAGSEKADDCPECVIDLSKLKNRGSAEPPAWGVLILVGRGTYGHWDDAYSATQVANALVASEAGATFLLYGDGVFLVAKEQDPAALGYINNLHTLRDFLDLGGKILVEEQSLAQRGLGTDDLHPGVEIIDRTRLVREIGRHQVALTF